MPVDIDTVIMVPAAEVRLFEDAPYSLSVIGLEEALSALPASS